MFGSLGGAELLLVLALALLLFGPRKLPEIGRTIGKGLVEFRRATNDFKSTLQREVNLEEVRDARDAVRAAGRDLGAAAVDATRLPVPRGSIDGPGRAVAAPAAETAGDGPSADAAESGRS